jgi:hypothetical protein
VPDQPPIRPGADRPAWPDWCPYPSGCFWRDAPEAAVADVAAGR